MSNIPSNLPSSPFSSSAASLSLSTSFPFSSTSKGAPAENMDASNASLTASGIEPVYSRQRLATTFALKLFLSASGASSIATSAMLLCPGPAGLPGPCLSPCWPILENILRIRGWFS